MRVRMLHSEIGQCAPIMWARSSNRPACFAFVLDRHPSADHCPVLSTGCPELTTGEQSLPNFKRSHYATVKALQSACPSGCQPYSGMQCHNHLCSHRALAQTGRVSLSAWELFRCNRLHWGSHRGPRLSALTGHPMRWRNRTAACMRRVIRLAPSAILSALKRASRVEVVHSLSHPGRLVCSIAGACYPVNTGPMSGLPQGLLGPHRIRPVVTTCEAIYSDWWPSVEASSR